MPKKVNLAERHADLARAAAAAIAKTGLTDVTLAHVAREAGWSIGALTHYIKTKDQLLLMTMQHAEQDIESRVHAVRQKYKGIEAIRYAMYEALPLSNTRPGLQNIWFGFWERSKQNPKIRNFINTRYSKSYKRCAEYVKEAQELGELPSDVDTKKFARSLIALLDGLISQHFISGIPISKRAQREHVDDWIVQLQMWTHAEKPNSGAATNSAKTSKK